MTADECYRRGDKARNLPATVGLELRDLASSNCLKNVLRLKGNKIMSVIAWIVLGLIAGFIASKIVNKQGEGFILDIVLGIVGAVVGGWLFTQFGAVGVTGFNLWSILVAVIGAIVVLVIYHAIRRTA